MAKPLGILLVLLILTACGGSSSAEEPTPAVAPELAAEGERLFQQTCFVCHGPDGKGLPNLGKDLTTSEFVSNSTDDELLDFVLAGRTVDDPENTTGVAMPPKGGFDFLTESDIEAIIAFVRSIHE